MDLSELRKEIDDIDRDLVQMFEKRMALCQEVAEYKIKTGMQVLDRKRAVSYTHLNSPRANQSGAKSRRMRPSTLSLAPL